MSWNYDNTSRAFAAVSAGSIWEPQVQEVRKVGHDLALTLLHHIPECAERTIAINKAREAVMYAQQALALHRD